MLAAPFRVVCVASLAFATNGLAQASRFDFASADRPLFGYSIQVLAPDQPDLFQLRRTDPGPAGTPVVTRVRTGSYDDCHRVMMAALEKRFGRGRSNVRTWTLGGRQFWSDEFVHAGWRIQRSLASGHHRLLDPRNVRHAWGSYEACRVRFERERIARGLAHRSKHAVVLLHGMGRSRVCFDRLTKQLREDGYEAIAVGYPSTRLPIRDHGAQIARVLDRSGGIDKLSFVTHSMGGLVAREALALKGKWRKRIQLGRLVMLGPPNQGAYLADRLEKLFPYRLIAGKGGRDLVSKKVRKMPIPKMSFAIIAGGRGDGKGYNPWIKGDDDGIVAVASTKLKGAADFLRVRELHTLMMRNDEVVTATRRFLRTGSLRAAAESK